MQSEFWRHAARAARSSLHEEGMLFNYSTCGIINVSLENAVFEVAAIRII